METLSKDETLRLRKKHIAKSCQIFFSDDPLKITRASGQYMYDENGMQYLDCINNVCHVGHCHPRVVKAAAEQMSVLNTNSRFLHDNLVLLAERLTGTFPEPLSVLFLCNSGSEATDLALNLARCHSKAETMLTMDRAYHGHVSSALSISPYKYSNKEDFMKYTNTEVVPCPDVYRGKHSPENAHRFVDEVKKIIDRCEMKGRKIAGFIAESMQSCGGQIEYPEKYLQQVYKLVRAAGGVCIADEVQVGFGRMGSCFWAFETQGVVPDIVTVGKPMGNGHPVSAVITTPEIAQSHAAMGMQYFNTFGGNPVSCAIALAVLDVIADEKLMENASRVGEYLTHRFLAMKEDIAIVGDVRGHGMFLGLELVVDRQTKQPATEEAQFVVARMRDEHILISRDGPHSNVIKFKPPMCFSVHNAEFLANKLYEALQEVMAIRGEYTADTTARGKNSQGKRCMSPYMSARLQALNEKLCNEEVIEGGNNGDSSPELRLSKKARMS